MIRLVLCEEAVALPQLNTAPLLPAMLAVMLPLPEATLRVAELTPQLPLHE